MKLLKKLFKRFFAHFSYFYKYLGSKIFVTLGSTVLVGTLDGLGLAMFLPLLEMVDGSKKASADGLGNLKFLVAGLESAGITLTLGAVLLVMLFFFVLKGVAKFWEGYYRISVQQYFIKELRVDSLRKLSRYDYQEFVKADVGRIQNTLSGETGRVVQAYRYYFETMQAIIMLLVYIVLAYFANPQFAILVTIGGALSNLLFSSIYARTKNTSRKITQDSHKYQGLLIQTVSFFKYLRATGQSSNYEKKLVEEVENIENSNKKIGFYNSILAAIREPVVMVIVVIVILIQVNYLGQSLGLMILSLLFFYRALNYVIQFQNTWNHFLNVSGSLENMTAFTQELKAGREVHGSALIEGFKNKIELEQVAFEYNAEAKILQNLSLTIHKNETIAFVGESGSGKTTLINMVAGLLKATKGNIKIDGIPYEKLNRTSLQQRIGYITQEPVIFSDTVFNNVSFWDNPTEENIHKFYEVLKLASSYEYVIALPDDKETVLGSNGVNLSGGQRQRIAIARELYKDIDILIMDEATSALDSETEKNIQQAIEYLHGRYTILIVAHRLSTIKNADRIVFMKNGSVESIDTFTNLVQSNDGFRRMVELQEV